MNRIQRPLNLLTNAFILFTLAFTSFNAAGAPALAAGLPVDATPVTFTAISANDGHTCGLTSDGGVRCWGLNTFGQLGNATNVDSPAPVVVYGLASGVSAISVGGRHTCALTTSGGVKCWGSNDLGQLGNGTTVDSSNIPVDVSGLTSDVMAVSAGGLHTCALTTSGSVKCWGWNFQGQLGNKTNADSASPVDVFGLTNGVSAISSGGYHTCALVGTGAYCWGNNQYGQLGNGDDTFTNSNFPVTVSGLTGISMLATGAYHSCAVTASGVECWGDNENGQLGIGTHFNKNIPLAVPGLTDASSIISAGGFHSCALITGAVKCWGRNDYGQLGNGTYTISNNPVDVPALTSGVSAITTGGYHSCALTTSGVKCWGFNFYGQLGDGTNVNEATPVDIINIDPPGTFNKNAPISGGTSNLMPTISWDASSGADSYEYCYDTSNDNVCSAWVSTGNLTSKTLNGLASATYYWQVRARNMGGFSFANDSASAYWSFKIDTIAPKVASIVRLDPNPSTAASLRFTVNFSEVVTGVDAADFNLTASGISGAAITDISGTGAARIVTISTGSGIGTLRLNVIDDDSIKDGVGNSLGGTGKGNGAILTGPKYTLDRNNLFGPVAAQDGWVLETSEISNLGGTLNTTNNLVLGDDPANKQYRSLLSFYTAGLPDNATIVKVSLKIKKAGIAGTDPFTSHGGLWADMSKGFFSTTAALQAADFQAAASKLAAGVFSPVPGAPGWYQMILTPANYTYINLVGPTQFRLRFALDDNGDYSADYATFYAGEAAAASRPVLVVEYTLP
jgi:alpha-tubulin suppressor-like RCC1 family protein